MAPKQKQEAERGMAREREGDTHPADAPRAPRPPRAPHSGSAWVSLPNTDATVHSVPRWTHLKGRLRDRMTVPSGHARLSG
jgi:hypothetical protein